MRVLCIVFVTVLMPLSLISSAAMAATLKNVPQITVRDINGTEVNLKKLADSCVVVVNFWATWCVPCATELKHIATFYDEFREKGLTVVAVSLDGVKAAARVRQHAKARKWAFTVVVDRNDELKQAFGVMDPPTVFVVQKGGVIAYTHSGYVAGDEKKLRTQIERALKTAI